MTTSSVPGWEDFVAENLLKSRLFSGLCLLSNQREVIYGYGTLSHISKEDIDQFFKTFSGRPSDESHRSFKLQVKANSGTKTSFRIYHRTHISVYATSSGNQSGLTVSKLPHGVFLALFHKPVVPHQAITLVENFTTKLRL